MRALVVDQSTLCALCDLSVGVVTVINVPSAGFIVYVVGHLSWIEWNCVSEAGNSHDDGRERGGELHCLVK